MKNCDKYPFFHQHRIYVQDSKTKNRVVYELLISCSGSFITRWVGIQIRIPSEGTSRKYRTMLKRKGNFIIVKRSSTLCWQKYNVALRSTKKMEPSKVESILFESGVGCSKSHVLFFASWSILEPLCLHLRKLGVSAFLGRSSNQ